MSTPPDKARHDRYALKFYGRRKGRPLRTAMQHLLKVRLPALTFDPAGILDAQFGRSADSFLEIGFGGGEHLAGLAAAAPDYNFIGAEPFVNGVASLLRYIEADNLTNIRIWPDDVRLFLPALPDHTLAGAFIMFPDPWPKRRHAARRILQPEMLDHLARLIRPGGMLVMASDDPTAKGWLLAMTIAHPVFEWTAKRPEDWRLRPAFLPKTRYMKKGDRAGRRSSWFLFRRGGDSCQSC